MLNIPIFLSSDNNYAPYIATTITSICDNTSEFCTFYILDGGIETDNKIKILSLMNHYDNCSIEYIDIDAEKYFKNFVTYSYITIPSYYRFLIPLLKPNLEKVLYLDVDIIVKNNILELFNTDLENKALGAVVDFGDSDYIKNLKSNVEINPSHTYFNAGVLLIDCKKWEEQDISKKLFEIEKKYRGKLLCNDQDVLNKVFENNYKILPQKFNALIVKEDTVIRHYYSKPKPWEIKQGIKNSNQLLSDIELFWYYAEKTPYYEQLCANCTYKSEHQFQFLKLYKKLSNKEISFPKVSVIIPVYNAENYLKRCLDSVVNQTLKDIEIICVNDCSTDNSINILNEYAQKYPCIKVIDCKVNGGESIARNIGLDNAQGEYIGFIDNDDKIDLDFYEKLYTKAKNDNADIVKGEVEEISYSGHKNKTGLNNLIIQSNDKYYFTYHWWTAIFSRQLLEKNNIRFLEKYPLGGDILFLNRAIIACKKLSIVNNVFYHYYRRENSGDSKILTLDKLKSALAIYDMCIDNLNNVPDINPSTLSYQTVCYWFIRSCIHLAYRNNSTEYKQITVQFLIKLYSKSKNKDYINANIIKDFSTDILDSIKTQNTEKLIKILSNYGAISKTMFSNLRKRMKNNNDYIQRTI